MNSEHLGFHGGRQSRCFTQPAAVLTGNFRRARLRPPIVHLGWSHETVPRQLPAQISFAYLDSDLYEPILESLEGVNPRLSSGGIVLIDGCGGFGPEWSDPFPGVRRACVHFLQNRLERLIPLFVPHCPQAYFIKH